MASVRVEAIKSGRCADAKTEIQDRFHLGQKEIKKAIYATHIPESVQCDCEPYWSGASLSESVMERG